MPDASPPPTSQVAPDYDGHQHARLAREAKRASAMAIGVSEEYISRFVERFYQTIRQDALLGPIFAERVSDWDSHLARMKAFWRSILHNSGEFHGNPMLKHVAIPDLEDRHFAHWLKLFYATLREEEPSTDATNLVGARARMIADSLLTGIATQRLGLSGVHAGKELPYV